MQYIPGFEIPSIANTMSPMATGLAAIVIVARDVAGVDVTTHVALMPLVTDTRVVDAT